MTDWNLVNSLQDERLKLEIELNNQIHSNASNDKINELRSEILYIEKRISKIIGTKEFVRRKELKNKKLGLNERNVRSFNALKLRYKQIGELNLSLKKMLATIEKINKDKIIEEKDRVKVKI